MSMYQSMEELQLLLEDPMYRLLHGLDKKPKEMFFAHEHLHYVVRKEWHDGVTIYKWLCPYCYTEGADMEEWVEPEGPYFGNPLIDHIMSCDNYEKI